MSAADVGLHLLALLVYPGGLLTIGFGLLGEIATRAVGAAGGGNGRDILAPLARLHRAAASAGPLLQAMVLLAVLAAAQLAAPLSPVSPVERNLLVAGVALVAATWLGLGWAWTAAGARLALIAQGCWLVALLAPALVSESLRPQALGAVLVPSQLPLKVASGVLYLACLPALLQVLPGAAPAGGRGEEAAAGRLLLWLPFCGLFASMFFPPAADDAGGVLRFLGLAAAAAALTIGVGAVAARLPEAAARGAYLRLAPPLAAVVLVVAAINAVST